MIAVLPPPPAPPPQDIFAGYGGKTISSLTFRVDPLKQYGGVSIPTAGPYTVQMHEKLAPLFEPARYKVLKGGRGGMKSWGIARALLVKGMQKKLRILCAREFQSSIADSVHKLLKDQIGELGLGPWYKVEQNRIKGSNGTEFIFVGLGDMALNQNRTKVKSFEAVDIVWIEEAETITEATWQILIPTIRKAGSEIWISFNPNLESDPTYQRFVVNPPPGTVVIEMNWRDNLWLSLELQAEKNYLFTVDPEAAEHVWDGKLKKHSEALIFKGKYQIHNFATIENPRWLHGVDWGFADDPTVMVRMYTTGTAPYEELWIQNEAWGQHVEINELVQDKTHPLSKPGLFDKLGDTAARWPIYADNARPECISYVRKTAAYNMQPCDKWEGCVEDGIKHIRGFVKVHIHKDNCPNTARDFGLYSWKKDKMTEEILPVIVGKHDHCPDAVRYGLNQFIQRRGTAAMWAKLGK